MLHLSRLARSSKTGQSSGYAFIEFKYSEVAKVIYLMLKPHKIFGCCRNWQSKMALTGIHLGHVFLICLQGYIWWPPRKIFHPPPLESFWNSSLFPSNCLQFQNTIQSRSSFHDVWFPVRSATRVSMTFRISKLSQCEWCQWWHCHMTTSLEVNKVNNELGRFFFFFLSNYLFIYLRGSIESKGLNVFFLHFQASL